MSKKCFWLIFDEKQFEENLTEEFLSSLVALLKNTLIDTNTKLVSVFSFCATN